MTIRLVRHLLLAEDESPRVTLSDVEDKLRSLSGSTQSLVKDAAPPTIGALVPARATPGAPPGVGARDSPYLSVAGQDWARCA